MLKIVKNLKVSTRIFLLSAVPTIGIAILGVTYYLSEQKITAAFDAAKSFDAVKSDYDIIGGSIVEMGLESNKFLRLHSMQSVDAFNKAANLATDALVDSKSKDTDPAVAEPVGKIRTLLPEYISSFSKIVELQGQIGMEEKDGLTSDMIKSGNQLVAAVGSLGSDDLTARARSAALLPNRLILSGMNIVSKDNTTFVMSDADIAIQLGRIGKDISARLVAMAASAEAQSDIEQKFADFQKKTQAFTVANHEMKNLVEQETSLYDQVQPLPAPINNWTSQQIDASDSSVEATRAWTSKMSAWITSIIFALLTFGGFLISRSIVGPMRSLTAGFKSLADGDVNVVIEGQDKKNELGDLARAADVFKANALAKGALEIEAKARSEEELARIAEMQEAERSLQQELTELVRAASVGDFSRRVDLSGKVGFMATLGDGVNRWAESISSAFSQIGVVTSAMASGDVTRRMEGNYEGDLLRLKTDVNRMGDQMSLIVGRIGTASSAVQGATQEIGAGVSDLSMRTEQQASSLEETAASMEELSATVRQNAENAQEANQLATATRNLAVNGGDIATHAVNAMGRIEQSSRQVSDIVGLIQEIAFQTNILALNAAVEAARAGEAGRGFAVVANEVRALAQRSSQASKEIKTLISNTNSSVVEGSDLVKQAGASLTDIVTAVRKVADIVSEIAAASQEQSSGIEQVSKAIGNMDEMTQRNAALVEETNAALQSAQSQVDELHQAVSFFKTGTAPSKIAVRPAIGTAKSANPIGDRLSQLAQKLMPRSAPTRSNLAAATDDWKEF